MNPQQETVHDRIPAGESVRARLLAGLPVIERQVQLAGVSTAVLEGGDGPPMVLLHGPGEFAASWLAVLPALVRTHRVIAPDLPGHGASEVVDGRPSADRVLGWLEELIAETCSEPPVLVGRVIGGAVGARFAIQMGARLNSLVLVDTLGLTQFEPAPRFALAMQRFLAAPTASSYDRFMDFCSFDLDGLRDLLDPRWEAFQAYAIELAAKPSVQAALGGLIAELAGPIPSAELVRIDVPTSLIWGRHDLATPLQVAESASAKYGWPLYVIEGAGDDPALEQPTAFLDALSDALTTTTSSAAVS